MSRHSMIVVALIGVLTACSTQGGGGTNDESVDAAPSVVASAPAEASTGASDGTATGSASAACADAFVAVGEQDVSSISAMGDLPEVEATIEQCESIADWIAGASQVIGEEVNPSTAQLLLDIRCQLPALADTAVCAEVTSS